MTNLLKTGAGKQNGNNKAEFVITYWDNISKSSNLPNCWAQPGVVSWLPGF